jgi:AcrR family transcriptional regulator
MAAPVVRPDQRSTREHLLDAAERLFAERGFYGTSLADICGEVGVAKSSLLHHFSSKNDVYAAVLERVADELNGIVEVSLAAAGDARGKALYLFEALLAWTRRRPEYNQIVLRELLDNAGRAGRLRRWFLKPAIDSMADIVAAAFRQSGLHDADSALFLFHTIGALSYVFAGLPTIAALLEEDDPDTFADRYFEYVRALVEAQILRAR